MILRLRGTVILTFVISPF